MRDSNVANAAKESAQAEFPHGLQYFCAVSRADRAQCWSRSDPARYRGHADRRLAPVRHGSSRMSWSNPQVVGKVAGWEIVAELGDGLGHDVLVTVLLTQDYEPHHPPGYPFRIAHGVPLVPAGVVLELVKPEAAALVAAGAATYGGQPPHRRSRRRTSPRLIAAGRRAATRSRSGRPSVAPRGRGATLTTSRPPISGNVTRKQSRARPATIIRAATMTRIARCGAGCG